MPIPPDPSLIGAVVLSQFGIADPEGAHLGMLALTPGLRIGISDHY